MTTVCHFGVNCTSLELRFGLGTLATISGFMLFTECSPIFPILSLSPYYPVSTIITDSTNLSEIYQENNTEMEKKSFLKIQKDKNLLIPKAHWELGC